MDKSNPLLIPMFQDLSNGILGVQFESCSLHEFLFRDVRLLKNYNSQVDYHLEVFGFSSFALSHFLRCAQVLRCYFSLHHILCPNLGCKFNVMVMIFQEHNWLC